MPEQSTQTVQAGIRALEDQSYNFLWQLASALNAIDYAAKDIDPASINADSTGSETISFTGAKQGDFVIVQPEAVGTNGLFVESSEVTSDGTVTVRIRNESGGAVDLGTTTFHVLVIKTDKKEIDISEIGTP